jgi:hypothetical protein
MLQPENLDCPIKSILLNEVINTLTLKRQYKTKHWIDNGPIVINGNNNPKISVALLTINLNAEVHHVVNVNIKNHVFSETIDRVTKIQSCAFLKEIDSMQVWLMENFSSSGKQSFVCINWNN